MPGRRATAPAPLAPEQVAELREQVGRGEQPRVVVRSGSAGLAAGARGSVVRVGEPQHDADEFIVVRVGKDEIPFAPAELGLPGRRGLAAVPEATAAERSRTAPRKQPARSRTPRKAVPAKQAAEQAGAQAPQEYAAQAPAGADAPARPAKRTAARRPSRAARRPASPVTLTLRFADGTWTAEATRGSRRVGRAAPVRAGAVRALADLIDDEAVSTLIAETVDSCRAEAEGRAAELREQLRAAEAALKEYDR